MESGARRERESTLPPGSGRSVKLEVTLTGPGEDGM